MSRVLVLIPYYLPGYRSGGPQRTIENLVDFFGETNEIYIMTQDHDFESSAHYDNITNNSWIRVGGAKVMYVSSKDFKWRALWKAYDKFDTIYSCGLFEQNSVSLLLLHRLKRNKGKRVFVAPMGVFSEGAFYNKSHLKKRVYISFFKAIGAFRSIIWSFTTEEEVQLAEQVIGNAINNYIVAEDLPQKVDFDRYRKQLNNYTKGIGVLRLVYISRIPEKKNLLYALKLLNFKYVGKIIYDIYGIKEDESYWQQCENEIKLLPDNIIVNYCGELLPNQVMDTFCRYDAFLFPTKGENYGHIIYEALCSGCIPIISDKTPWKGKDILFHELEDENAFRIDITKFLEMDYKEMIEKKVACICYAKEVYRESTQDSGYNRLFI